MDEFPKKINLFKLRFDGERRIYKYDKIPEGEKENDYVKYGNEYFSLRRVVNPNEIEFKPYFIRKIIENEFIDRLLGLYQFNNKYVFYKQNSKIPHDARNENIFSIYRGFEYRFVPLINDMFLCIDYGLIIKINASIKDFLSLNAPLRYLIGSSVEIKIDGVEKRNGVLTEVEADGNCIVDIYNADKEKVPSDKIFLLCRPEVLEQILKEINRPEDVILLQRQNSLLNPRRRLVEIKNIVKNLNDEKIFPILIEGLKIFIDNEPLPIEEVGFNTSYDNLTLKCDSVSTEPELQFDKGSSYIQPFPTQYPPYLRINKLNIVLYYPKSKENEISTFLEGLKRYLMNYFYVEDFEANKQPINYEPFTNEYAMAIKQSLKFNNKLNIGIIYVPQIMKYYKNSPYFTLKTYFASQGIPTQMITDKTFLPTKYPLNYTLLNICTAIIAKCGGVPWVLKAKLENTDVIIGMSLSARLTNIGDNIQKNRYIGFANVFNEYGKWLYFFGKAHLYDKNQQVEQISNIIREIKQYYSSKNNYVSPKNIIIHNSKRFKKTNQEATYTLLKDSFGVDTKVAFITIDESHNYRCFDSNSQDGSFPRRHYVYLNDKEILLSTTGISELKGVFRLGTPKMLHIISDQYPVKFLNLNDVAFQILAMTKLNWASVTPAQREPVSIKYANKLAYIAANTELPQWEGLSDRLFDKPWFI